jgi:hypothetical protein
LTSSTTNRIHDWEILFARRFSFGRHQNIATVANHSLEIQFNRIPKGQLHLLCLLLHPAMPRQLLCCCKKPLWRTTTAFFPAGLNPIPETYISRVCARECIFLHQSQYSKFPSTTGPSTAGFLLDTSLISKPFAPISHDDRQTQQGDAN